MAVERQNAAINQEIILRFDFIYDRSMALFDPDSVDSVEILDSDRTTVLETITSANITKISTGKYRVTTSSSWNTSARKVYDRWNITVNSVSYDLVAATFINDSSSPSVGMASFVTLVKRKIKAPTSGITTLVDPDDYESFINEAVKEYSKRRPYQKTVKNTGDGTFSFDVPADWDTEFSWVREIEYPIDNSPPCKIQDSKYEVIQLDTGWKVRFIGEYYPSLGEYFYLRYVIRHSVSDSSTTVPDAHKEAVCNLAASIGCQALAELYGHTANASIEADTINYREKGDMFSSRSKELYKLYDRAVKEIFSGVRGELDMQLYWERNKDGLNKSNRII
jgi:hypothetical protein